MKQRKPKRLLSMLLLCVMCATAVLPRQTSAGDGITKTRAENSLLPKTSAEIEEAEAGIADNNIEAFADVSSISADSSDSPDLSGASGSSISSDSPDLSGASGSSASSISSDSPDSSDSSDLSGALISADSIGSYGNGGSNTYTGITFTGDIFWTGMDAWWIEPYGTHNDKVTLDSNWSCLGEIDSISKLKEGDVVLFFYGGSGAYQKHIAVVAEVAADGSYFKTADGNVETGGSESNGTTGVDILTRTDLGFSDNNKLLVWRNQDTQVAAQIAARAEDLVITMNEEGDTSMIEAWSSRGNWCYCFVMYVMMITTPPPNPSVSVHKVSADTSYSGYSVSDLYGAVYGFYNTDTGTYEAYFGIGANGDGYLLSYKSGFRALNNTSCEGWSSVSGTINIPIGTESIANEWGFADPTVTEAEVPAGNYILVETAVPTGGKYDFPERTEISGKKAVKNFTIDGAQVTDGKFYLEEGSYTSYIVAEDPLSEGELYLKKVSADTSVTSGNDCYSLSGAVYGVYSDSSCTTTVGTLTTTADGTSNTLELPLGTYYIKEIKPSEGFALDDTVYSATVRTGETAAVTCKETPQSNPVKNLLIKIDAETGESLPQGSASLEGALFTVDCYGGFYSAADEAEASGSPALSFVLKSDSDGYIYFSESYKVSGDTIPTDSSGDACLPLGTVVICETEAPEGYLINTEKYVVQITSGGTTENVYTYNEAIYSEQIIRGGVEIHKRDLETGYNTPQGGASLAGAEFEIRNESAEAIWFDRNSDGIIDAENEWIKPGGLVDTIITDEEGHAILDVDGDGKADTDALPYGTYSITEVKAPEGYLLGTGGVESGEAITKIFKICGDGIVVSLDRQEDIESDEPAGELSPEGTAASPGEQEDTDNDETAGGLSPEGTAASPDEQEGTDNDETAGGLSPEGTAVSPGEQEDTDNDETASEDNAVYDQVIRGDFLMQKKNSGYEAMTGVVFKISSNTTGETHYFVTDANGCFSSAAADKSNAIDAAISEDGEVCEEKLEELLAGHDRYDDWYGIWFGAGASAEAELNSLPYDIYTITELRSSANEGYVLREFTLTVNKDKYVIDYGTIVDSRVTIKTTAENAEDGTHFAGAEEGIGIIENAFITNLNIGETYTVKAVLADPETGRAYEDEDGNTYEESVTVRASRADDTYRVVFDSVNCAGLEGKSLVVFAYVCDQNGYNLASEEDLEEADETIYFPVKDELPETPEETEQTESQEETDSPETPEETEQTESQEETDSPETPEETEPAAAAAASPGTGDNANLAVWGGIALLALLGAGGSIFYIIRKRKTTGGR